ncbi:MAG: polysaccharide deacetylase family protein [Candidatus Krumholzibacteria bacterium]
MSRLLNHWKLLQDLGGELYGAPAPSPHAHPPIMARFKGVTVWIHPVADADQKGLFLTDDGKATFDPENAIANLQFERYVPHSTPDARKTEFLKKVYYLLKPLMPRSLQLTAQRANARSRLASVEFPGWPQDDTLDEFLRTALRVLMERADQQRVPFIGFWPMSYHWAACFTHDVETSKGLAFSERMAALEESHGIRSTWFVVPERYPVSQADLQPLQERGHEIGVHGLNHDGKLFSSRQEFERRALKINRYIEEWGAVGFRSPALYRNAEWICDLRIDYDSSFMDTAVLEPQLGGVSTVFPYHIGERTIELPITMPMDHHLINLLRTDTTRGMLKKFEWVRARHGLANFLYHPDYNLAQERLDDYGRVVASVVRTERGWIATAAAIADWWQRRSRSSLVGTTDDPRVEGPAALDAAIWYARRDGDQVHIEPAPR